MSFIYTYSVFVLGSTPDFICASLHLEDNGLHSVSWHKEFYSKLNWNIVLFLVNSIRIFSGGPLKNHWSGQTLSVLHCKNKYSFGRPTRSTAKQTSSEGMTWSMDIWLPSWWPSWHDWRSTSQWKCDYVKMKHKNMGGPSFWEEYKTRCICPQTSLPLKQRGQAVNLVNTISLKREVHFLAELLYSNNTVPIFLYPYVWILYGLTHSFYYLTKLQKIHW